MRATLQSLTALNSSRVMTLFMSESNWLNRFRMATNPEDTRSSSLGLPSAVTCRQSHQCQGSVYSAAVRGAVPHKSTRGCFSGIKGLEGACLCRALHGTGLGSMCCKA